MPQVTGFEGDLRYWITISQCSFFFKDSSDFPPPLPRQDQPYRFIPCQLFQFANRDAAVLVTDLFTTCAM